MRGTSSNLDGQYEIKGLEPGEFTITVSFLGYRDYTVDFKINAGENTLNIKLEPDYFGLDEVVVTGVGQGTQTKKLGFTVAKVDAKALTTVPANDVGTALQGKVPGVSIVRPSGDPSAPATIRLRGSTSLGDNQEPLIIIDGIITDGNLADINMQDVESIEIVPGAAGASLYGSIAGNGVIQIVTKRGNKSIGKPQINFRSEFGFSTLANEYPVTNNHGFVNDAVLTADGQAVESWQGYATYDEDPTYDNPYPVLYDNLDKVFSGQPFNSNYVRLSNATNSFNYMISAEQFVQGGVIENLQDFERNSFRVNTDYTYKGFDVQFSGSYVASSFPNITEQGQGANFFYSALIAAPVINFGEQNPDGTPSNNPRGYDVIGDNFQNPLYVASNFNTNSNRDRYIAGIKAGYEFSENFRVDGRQSFDRTNNIIRSSTPVGYQTPTPSPALNNGSESRTISENTTQISELWATYSLEKNNWKARAIGKYLYEDRSFESFGFSGDTYSASGITNFAALDQTSFQINNFLSEERAENYILDVEFDYDDKLILGAMGRRDGSSSFGEDNRYRFFYRGSAAYRLSEDISINNVDELKLRASYGTSGQRPPFQAQFETYSVGATTITPNILGNNEITPSVVAEMEFGIDAFFLNRFDLTVNYAQSNVTDDYLLVPLTGDNSFSSQWQNVGEIQTKTFELALQTNLVNKDDLRADLTFAFSTTSQEVTDLGGAPAFTRSAGAAIELFRFEEGESIGAMYGNRLLSSVDQLTVGEDGTVLNLPGGFTPDQFSINQLGHVVLTDAIGTSDERPMYLVDETGTRQNVRIGDTQPDFQLGTTGNLNYKNFNVFMVWDWSYGGEVYNYTRQLMYFQDRHLDLETYTRNGLHPDYLKQTSGLYNGGEAVSHFVENASFLKLRELSVSYTIGNKFLQRLGIGNAVRSVQLSAVGRNLIIITPYTGFDPEVALRTNATNFRIDEFAYPNFRTFSGAVNVRF